jgi:hypothetical protein
MLHGHVSLCLHIPAGYHLHPAVLDAMLQAAQLASAAEPGLLPRRQQLTSLASCVPAARECAGDTTGGSSSQQAVSSCCTGTGASTVSLQAAADGRRTAQLCGLAFAPSMQLDSRTAGTAAALQSPAAEVTPMYHTVWLADCPEAAEGFQPSSGSSRAALPAAAEHHRLSFGGSGALRRSVWLRAAQPPSVAAAALLAALQQSAVSRDKQVAFTPEHFMR